VETRQREGTAVEPSMVRREETIPDNITRSGSGESTPPTTGPATPVLSMSVVPVFKGVEDFSVY
jgi:hypothetical protein